jgi:hypothetical protein
VLPDFLPAYGWKDVDTNEGAQMSSWNCEPIMICLIIDDRRLLSTTAVVLITQQTWRYGKGFEGFLKQGHDKHDKMLSFFNTQLLSMGCIVQQGLPHKNRIPEYPLSGPPDLPCT